MFKKTTFKAFLNELKLRAQQNDFQKRSPTKKSTNSLLNKTMLYDFVQKRRRGWGPGLRRLRVRPSQEIFKKNC